MKIAVVGASGLVGKVMLKLIGERLHISPDKILAVASDKSLGKKISFMKKEIPIISAKEALEEVPEIVLFSAGAKVSGIWAPKFAAKGSVVIDNSSRWRKKKDIPLVVSEINATVLTENHKIIANPNCSTIQLVLAVFQIHRNYGIRRMVLATYQSVSGSGIAGLNQLYFEKQGAGENIKAYPHPIENNIIPHGGNFLENGYTAEEMKLLEESRKILDDTSIAVTSTVVRVPVTGGHSIAANLELKKHYELNDILALLNATPGLIVEDSPLENIYPMPLFAEGKDEVFVGRIRRDESVSNGLNLWIVADNLRKGAATNAVQIAEYLINNKLINKNIRYKD